MNIYEIDRAMQECIDEETGEVKIDEFEALQMLREEKIENVACWIKNLSSDITALKAEKKTLDERITAKMNKVESLKSYLKYALNGEKFETVKCAISFRKSQAVDIVNMLEIPQEFLRFKPAEADKAAIKKALTDGEVVSGARLIENINMQIK